MTPIQVLLIDDDMMAQKFADIALSDRGMTCYSAYDTTEADVILNREKIDVIVCDVQMSPENGLEYCHRLRNQQVRIPIILISGHVSPVVVQTAQKERATYLIKPFAIDQMYQRIIEVLAEPTPVTA